MSTVRPFDLSQPDPVTMIHSSLLDGAMPDLSPSGWKVLCVVIRQPGGIRYDEFIKMSGLSRGTVAQAITECVLKGYLWREPADDGPGFQYYVDLEHAKRKASAILQQAQKAAATRSLKSHLCSLRRSQFQKDRARLMLAVIAREGVAECKRCGSQDGLTLDHIVPLSKGGSDDPENLQLLCASCNSSKGDRDA